ncbi:hypothetical protein [Hydrogenophaga sp.]|uniref:DUF7940 domain-containing protein n=1 Tax=Hydrogenophaga sp. TaxID=1904254 RepID=UPI0027301A88|nr:hypothetical protein [Hydrogenophaga sp.]MDP1686895.1 hypothetical protein [Hydrogenophaga sp.]
MKLELVPNWKRVLLRSWAVLMAVLSGLLASAEAMHADLMALLPVLQPYVQEGTAAIASAVVAGLVPVVRIFRQASLAVDEASREKP